MEDLFQPVLLICPDLKWMNEDKNWNVWNAKFFRQAVRWCVKNLPVQQKVHHQQWMILQLESSCTLKKCLKRWRQLQVRGFTWRLGPVQLSYCEHWMPSAYKHKVVLSNLHSKSVQLNTSVICDVLPWGFVNFAISVCIQNWRLREWGVICVSVTVLLLGETDPEDVLRRFLSQKQTLSRLSYLRSITEKEKQELQKQRDYLATELEAFKFAEVKGDEQ